MQKPHSLIIMFEATLEIATLISLVQPDIWNLEADTGRLHKVTGCSGEQHCAIEVGVSVS